MKIIEIKNNLETLVGVHTRIHTHTGNLLNNKIYKLK